jgi:hypothetical protein
MSRRTPKNLKEYLDPMISGCRLINLAMERVMFAKKGYKVKWEITIRYYLDPLLAENDFSESIVRPVMGKFSSGELEPDPPLSNSKEPAA